MNEKNRCEWADLCEKLDNCCETQRIFYCLKTISECYKNIHWKKRATYSIKPHLDKWDQLTFSLNFSNPLFRIQNLRSNCTKRDDFSKIAIPFMHYKKPLHLIKKQELQTGETIENFHLPSRLESSLAFSLFLVKEIPLLGDLAASFSKQKEKEEVYHFIASMLSSIKSDFKLNICSEYHIRNIVSDYVDTAVQLDQRLVAQWNGIYRKLGNSNLSTVQDAIDFIKIHFQSYMIDQYSVNLIVDTYLRIQQSCTNNEVSLFPAHAIRNYLYYRQSFFSDHGRSQTSNEIIDSFMKIGLVYLRLLYKYKSRLIDLKSILKNSDSSEKIVKEAIGINFFFNFVDNWFPAIVPIDKKMNDGKIEVCVLSDSIRQYFNPVFDAQKQKFKQKVYDLPDDTPKNRNVQILTVQYYMIKFFGALIAHISKIRIIRDLLLKIKFLYDISLESAESVNVKFEVDDIAYRIKEPRFLGRIFSRFKYSDNYLNISTRKKSFSKPYFAYNPGTLPDYGNSSYTLEIQYRLTHSLAFFLIMIAIISAAPILLKGEIVTYLLGGALPIIVFFITTFSLGSWSLTHRLVKPFKIVFAGIVTSLLLKMIFILIGKLWPIIGNSLLYYVGKKMFYIDL